MANDICFLKVKSATDEWIKTASNSQRLYAGNHGEYSELNTIANYPYMLIYIKELMALGDLYLLSSQPS